MGPKQDSLEDLPPNEKNGSPPPSYYPAEENDITSAFSKLTFNSLSETPNVDQCIAHLKLLEAINQLREDVGNQDGLYGIKNSLAASEQNEQARSQVLTKVHEKRWGIFVTLAVHRFKTYFRTIQPDSQMMDSETMEKDSYSDIINQERKLSFNTENLPPLGKHSQIEEADIALNPRRCPHGSSLVHVESPKLPVRLHQVRQDEVMDDWNAMGCHSRRRRQRYLRISSQWDCSEIIRSEYRLSVEQPRWIAL